MRCANRGWRSRRGEIWIQINALRSNECGLPRCASRIQFQPVECLGYGGDVCRIRKGIVEYRDRVPGLQHGRLRRIHHRSTQECDRGYPNIRGYMEGDINAARRRVLLDDERGYRIRWDIRRRDELLQFIQRSM